jgi:hypothetical protein
MIRRLSAAALIGAGVIWCIGFPKKASFAPDMVLSVALGIGLIATGVIVLSANRFQRAAWILAALLLWSLLANAYFLALNRSMSDLIRSSNRGTAAAPGSK